MSEFLFWNNEDDCNDSLFAIDAEYGCPYVLDNGYRMDTWAKPTKADTRNQWGFQAPDAMPGKSVEALNARLVPGYTRVARKADDWSPPDPVENGRGRTNGNGNGNNA